MTVEQVIDLVSRGGVITLLIFIGWGGYKQWWVWGWVYRERQDTVIRLREQRDEWQRMAMANSGIAEEAISRIQGQRRI